MKSVGLSKILAIFRKYNNLSKYDNKDLIDEFSKLFNMEFKALFDLFMHIINHVNTKINRMPGRLCFTILCNFIYRFTADYDLYYCQLLHDEIVRIADSSYDGDYKIKHVAYSLVRDKIGVKSVEIETIDRSLEDQLEYIKKVKEIDARYYNKKVQPKTYKCVCGKRYRTADPKHYQIHVAGKLHNELMQMHLKNIRNYMLKGR